jgi:uncharacterized OB-fold protein
MQPVCALTKKGLTAVTTSTAREQVAVRGTSFRIPDDPAEPPRLLGSACTGCGARFAGRRAICLACGGRALEDRLLSPTGTVWTFTIIHLQPPGAIVDPPYAIAQVRLDDGPFVTSLLTGVRLADVRVGLPVEMVLHDTGRVEEDKDVVAFAFRPRREAA